MSSLHVVSLACKRIVHQTSDSPDTVEEPYHLHKLGILNTHRMNDAQESFITREKRRPSSKSISLHHTLTCMFTEDLDDAASFPARSDVPLEVAT